VSLTFCALLTNCPQASLNMGEGAKNMFVSGTWDACGQLVSNAQKVKETAANLPYISWNAA
ncbi:MAG: hypothetical protein AAFR37_19220, partial [Cyanobacteria bacterium J06628_3]